MYKKGDKVMFCCADGHKRFPAYYPKVGTVGTVMDSLDDTLIVQWPKGTTSDEDMWTVAMRRVKAAVVDKIIITRKNNEVHCVRITTDRKYRTVARCAPGDEFDFEKGALIAMLRMMERKGEPA